MDSNTVPKTDKQIINHAITTLTGDKAQWLLWRSENEGKKVPYTKSNKRADVTDPNDWLTYEDTQEGLASDGEYSGVGLALDGTILGIDLDKCLNDAEELTDPVLQAFVIAAKTYTEISPSGTGLHLLFKLTGPIKLLRNRHAGTEIYTKERFLTFSGNLYEQHTVRTIAPAEAEHILGILGYPWSPVKTESIVAPVLSPIQHLMQFDALKQKMFTSKHGKEIKALYDGDASLYGGDTSKADAALCKHLAYWTNNDREAVKALWLSSPLGQRDKTQQRTDYVERTLDLALPYSSGDTGTQSLTVTEGSSNGSTNSAKDNVRKAFLEVEIDLVDFLKQDIKTEWDVEQLITKGSLNMIASAPHQGKTFVALHIATCVANGLPVFGHFKVPEAKNVIIINEEDVPGEIQGRLQSMSPEQVEKGRIILHPLTGQKLSSEWAEVVIERAQAHNVGLVILDNLGASSLANENEAHAMQQVMDCFRKIVKVGITVIFIHHDRKGQSNDSDTLSSLERARGSSVIAASVHGYLSVQALPDDQFKISQVKLKANVQKVKPFIVKMHQTITPLATFRYEFEYINEYNSELTAADNVQTKVMQYCRSKGPLPFTRKTLVEAGIATSAEDKTLRKALKWMENKEYLTSQRLIDVSGEKLQMLDSDTQRHNTLVYTPTIKLLELSKESTSQLHESNDTDLESIPF